MKQTSKPKRKRQPTRWLSLLLAVTLCIVIFLPIAVNRTVNRILNNAITSGNGTFKLHHVGLTHSIFSAMLLPDSLNGTAPAKIDSCVLEYRPFKLLQGRIDAVRFSGVSLLTSITNGTVKIPAIDVFSNKEASATRTSRKPTLKIFRKLPASIASISLEGHILLETLTERQAIPIRVNAECIDGHHWEKIAIEGTASLSSAQLSGTLFVDTTDETLTATLYGPLSTDALPYSLQKELPKAIQRAATTVDAWAKIQLDGPFLRTFKIEADFELDVATTAGDIICSPRFTAQGDPQKIEGSVSKIEATINYLPLKLGATNVVWQRKDKTLDGNISLNVANNPPLSVAFHSDPENTQIAIADATNGWSGAVYAAEMRARWTGARLTATGGARTPAAIIPPLLTTFSLDTLTLKNRHAETLLEFPNGINARANIESTTQHIIGQATLNSPTAVWPKKTLAILDTTIACDGSINSKGLQHLDAKLQGNATFRDVAFASIDSSLRQQAPGHFLLNTHVDTLGITGRVESVITTASANGYMISNTLAIAEQTLDLTKLQKILPETTGMSLTGKLVADAHYTMRPGKRDGAIRGQLAEGTIDWPEKKLSASDIRLMVDLPALPTLRSHAQFFGFKNFKLGRIIVDSGIAVFQIQEPTVWYLNNLVLDWCGGKVRGESVRISKNDQKTRITLHANHILLPELLTQVGIGVDAGEGGRMNGSLPILIENGHVTVTDGFLHSTPGKTSRMKLIPTARLRRTAATSIELSLAVEALSDFTYSWLRLSVDSDAENLNIKFEIDGKPAKKLYYTLSDGTLIETRHANTFKGISLDSTFRLPLNEILSITNPTSSSRRSEPTNNKAPKIANPSNYLSPKQQDQP